MKQRRLFAEQRKYSASVGGNHSWPRTLPAAQPGLPPGRSWCGWLGLLLRCGPPGGRRFSITVKMDLKIAAAVAAIG